MQDLGWMNGWKTTPKEVLECRKLEHKVNVITSHEKCVSKIVCNLCKYYYRIDSSD